MTKQIEIHGQLVKLYSLDAGRTWSSSPQSIVAYGHRKTALRLEVQKSFKRIDEAEQPNSDRIGVLNIPLNFVGR